MQNGCIIASLFSGSMTALLSGGNISDMTGSCGGIGLNSGVTAGTDGLSAWMAWEAPVDVLPSV